MVKEPDAKVKASWITFSHSERNYSRPPPLPEDRSTWTPEQKEQAERLAREGIDIFKQVSTAVAAKVMRDKPAVISFSGADDTGKRQRTYDRLSRSLVSFFPDYIAFATGGAKGSDGRYDGKSFYLVDRTRFHVDKLFEHLASKPDIQILAKSLWFPARSFGYGFVLKSEYHRQLDEVAFDVENWMDETESVFT